MVRYSNAVPESGECLLPGEAGPQGGPEPQILKQYLKVQSNENGGG
jgi:hypothetical protein